MRKRLVWVIISLVAACCLLGAYFWGNGKQEIRLSRSEIQSKLNEKLPQTRGSVTVTKVDVELVDNMVRLHIEAEAKKFGQNFSTTTDVTGTPVYDQERAAFFFLPKENGLKTHVLVNGKTIAEETGRALEYINLFVNAERMMMNEKVLGKSAEEKLTGVFETTATHMLMTRPIYVLPTEGKGMIARAMLAKVEVQQDVLVLELSFLRLTIWVIACLLGFVVALLLAIAAVLAPELMLSLFFWLPA